MKLKGLPDELWAEALKYSPRQQNLWVSTRSDRAATVLLERNLQRYNLCECVVTTSSQRFGWPRKPRSGAENS